MKVLLQ